MGVKLQTIADFRRYLAAELSEIYATGESTAIASFLLESVTGLPLLEQMKNGGRKISADEAARIEGGLSDLKQHKPVQHIAGYGWFMNRRFMVNNSVLIPRQETEELVIMTIKQAGERFDGTLIDFCTGSGCISITLALMLPGADIWATDLPDETLDTAARNIRTHNARVNLLKHNLLEQDFSGLPPADIIVANPPYVRESEKETIKPVVLLNEPHGALFVPDSDPLQFYRALSRALEALLKPGGWFCFEINEALAEETLETFGNSQLTNFTIVNDINSKNRFICGTRDSL
ncbi:MAG: peptide chain release factor N(5)-glutamine methyltransferase [Bacteroidales bacterium]